MSCKCHDNRCYIHASICENILLEKSPIKERRMYKKRIWNENSLNQQRKMKENLNNFGEDENDNNI